MTEPHQPHSDHDASREERMSALFEHMILQQSNMAMMLMGRIAHPETGKTMQNLDAAKLFIDQLEMIEARTKGNLDKHEEKLIKQSLMNLRLAFVEAVESTPTDSGKAATAEPPKEPAPKPGAEESGSPAPPAEETHKKFSKKY